jgi:hypothetical protein
MPVPVNFNTAPAAWYHLYHPVLQPNTLNHHMIVFKWLQGAPCYDTELQELLADASACIQQALQQAAAAKQPLLLTSSQHTRCAQPVLLTKPACSDSSTYAYR